MIVKAMLLDCQSQLYVTQSSIYQNEIGFWIFYRQLLNAESVKPITPNSGATTEELNRFLRGQKVLEVEKHFMHNDHASHIGEMILFCG